jgi:hypothetical protein
MYGMIRGLRYVTSWPLGTRVPFPTEALRNKAGTDETHAELGEIYVRLGEGAVTSNEMGRLPT